MDKLIERIKQQFKEGSMAIKLIMVNLGVFVLTVILSLVLKLVSFDFNLLSYFGASSDWLHVLIRPWTLVTYLFSHSLIGIGHLFWNMVMLYFAGTFFITKLGNKKLLSVYLVGGFAGFIFYFVGYNVLPAFAGGSSSILVGASASVMAILVTIGVMNPDYPLKFVFISKPIKLIYIVGGLVLLDLVRLQADIGNEKGNAGGWLAHLGGIGFGLFYGSQLLKGKNILKGFEKFLDSLFSFSFSKNFVKRKPKMKVKQGGKAKANAAKAEYKKTENRLEAVIEKVKKSGYDSLTKTEKELFFSNSKR